MDSRPGTLKGSGVRTLPADRVGGMLARIKEAGSGKRRRLRSVRYRITGFRDSSGAWVMRNPRNGHYYIHRDGAHRTRVRPTAEMIRRTDMISLEVEIDRGQGPRIYYTSVPGL